VFSLAVGASLEVGAQFDVGGRMVGPLRTISLWSSDGISLRWLLLALPIAVGVANGIRTERKHPALPSAAKIVVGTAAIVAVAVGVLAAIGDARLGAGLVKQNGVGLVAVDALQAAILTFLWLALGGTLSAFVAHHRTKGIRA
jgi:hypothetical protein